MLNKFGSLISSRLSELGITSASKQVIIAVCRSVHTASLITEEGKFVQGSITVADPTNPDQPPRIRRADYPAFTSLAHPVALTPEFFAKLARAVDQWSGSIAVWGSKSSKIVVWGIIDQLVGTNTYLNREDEGGFANPGLLTVIIDRPGDLTAYHGTIFLGSLRAQRIIQYESEPFKSSIIRERLNPVLSPISIAICNALSKQVKTDEYESNMLYYLMDKWQSTIARICIGLRRLGTGGALIISSSPILESLSISQKFEYDRLAESLALDLLDSWYLWALEDDLMNKNMTSVRLSLVHEIGFARADATDRADELRGSIKLVTSLAAMDGALLLTPDLRLVGFGVKITAVADPETVYEGDDFEEKGTRAKKVDISQFGTRHTSMLRYCRTDPNAIGVVISQDGHVRVITTYKNTLLMWDRIQLLRHKNFTKETSARFVKQQKRIGTRRSPITLGYSLMPKTLSILNSKKLS